MVLSFNFVSLTHQNFITVLSSLFFCNDNLYTIKWIQSSMVLRQIKIKEV